MPWLSHYLLASNSEKKRLVNQELKRRATVMKNLQNKINAFSVQVKTLRQGMKTKSYAVSFTKNKEALKKKVWNVKNFKHKLRHEKQKHKNDPTGEWTFFRKRIGGPGYGPGGIGKIASVE